MSHSLEISTSCGFKCNPASSSTLNARNSHSLFTRALNLPIIDGYNCDELTTEEESIQMLAYVIFENREDHFLKLSRSCAFLWFNVNTLPKCPISKQPKNNLKSASYYMTCGRICGLCPTFLSNTILCRNFSKHLWIFLIWFVCFPDFCNRVRVLLCISTCPKNDSIDLAGIQHRDKIYTTMLSECCV